jgi:hypothetical protein
MQTLFQTAKPFNATIKHASAKQFSTHLNNMYEGGTRKRVLSLAG